MRICSRAGARFCTAASRRHCAIVRRRRFGRAGVAGAPLTQAGLTEAAIEWWGKAGQRSLERSALVEAVEQFTCALDLIATLPGTPALRREQIKFQVSLITPLMHIKGYAASETMAAEEQAAPDRTSGSAR